MVAKVLEWRLLPETRPGAGPTAQVYHHPASEAVAEVFSDPPMNLVSVEVKGGTARFPQGLELPLTGSPGLHVTLGSSRHGPWA